MLRYSYRGWPTASMAWHTAETMSSLKPATCEYGYLSTILTRIILFVQFPTRVEAIGPALHLDVRMTNDNCRLCVGLYIAKYL